MRPGADSVKDKGQIAEFVSTRYVGEGKMNVHPERMKDSSLKRVEPRIISSLVMKNLWFFILLDCRIVGAACSETIRNHI